MPRPVVDLSAHINQTVERGHPADFPVALVPIHREHNGGMEVIPHRFAVARLDTGQVLSVVSDRYQLVPHTQILEMVDDALEFRDLGPVPRGIYVDRGGGRMRALFKFPALEHTVWGPDRICPCLKIENTYDGTSRISIHIGAFRFVCTNLAVGGGGAFAGGFMSIHAGEIPLERVGEQLTNYLDRFADIVEFYRVWSQRPLGESGRDSVMEGLPLRAGRIIFDRLRPDDTVYDGYNVCTSYATHETRSARVAFDLLATVNHLFQERFPLNRA